MKSIKMLPLENISSLDRTFSIVNLPLRIIAEHFYFNHEVWITCPECQDIYDVRSCVSCPSCKAQVAKKNGDKPFDLSPSINALGANITKFLKPQIIQIMKKRILILVSAPFALIYMVLLMAIALPFYLLYNYNIIDRGLYRYVKWTGLENSI